VYQRGRRDRSVARDLHVGQAEQPLTDGGEQQREHQERPSGEHDLSRVEHPGAELDGPPPPADDEKPADDEDRRPSTCEADAEQEPVRRGERRERRPPEERGDRSTTSVLQKRTAGPRDGPPTRRIHRLAGTAISVVAFTDGTPRSTPGAVNRVAIPVALWRQSSSNVCAPGTIGSVTPSPSCRIGWSTSFTATRWSVAPGGMRMRWRPPCELRTVSSSVASVARRPGFTTSWLASIVSVGPGTAAGRTIFSHRFVPGRLMPACVGRRLHDECRRRRR
jgi:hypothetical protein